MRAWVFVCSFIQLTEWFSFFFSFTFLFFHLGRAAENGIWCNFVFAFVVIVYACSCSVLCRLSHFIRFIWHFHCHSLFIYLIWWCYAPTSVSASASAALPSTFSQHHYQSRISNLTCSKDLMKIASDGKSVSSMSVNSYSFDLSSVHPICNKRKKRNKSRTD